MSAEPAKPPRPASTILLLRDSAANMERLIHDLLGADQLLGLGDRDVQRVLQRVTGSDRAGGSRAPCLFQTDRRLEPAPRVGAEGHAIRRQDHEPPGAGALPRRCTG